MVNFAFRQLDTDTVKLSSFRGRKKSVRKVVSIQYQHGRKGTGQAGCNCYQLLLRRVNSLVFFFLLCRYFNCCLHTGNDSNRKWHFPGLQPCWVTREQLPLPPCSPSWSFPCLITLHNRWAKPISGQAGKVREREMSLMDWSSCTKPAWAAAQPLCLPQGKPHGNWGADVMRTGTGYFWHEKWALHPKVIANHAGCILTSDP